MAFSGLAFAALDLIRKRALGSLAALVVGRVVFSERVRPKQILAVAVMVAGVFFVLT